LLLVATVSPPPVQFVGIGLIGELKDFGESLGGHATDNFRRHSARQTADTRCYFTGKLQLPEFSSTFLTLDRDADLFLKKSFLVNTYYEKVRALYDDLRSGQLTPQQTLERKASLFSELQQSCSEITPDPVSFNKCPAVMNNAGLAFDRRYTRNYPMFHDLYRLLGGDRAKLVTTLKRLMSDWPATAAGAADLITTE
jgi:hypothetical protein